MPLLDPKIGAGGNNLHEYTYQHVTASIFIYFRVKTVTVGLTILHHTLSCQTGTMLHGFREKLTKKRYHCDRHPKLLQCTVAIPKVHMHWRHVSWRGDFCRLWPSMTRNDPKVYLKPDRRLQWFGTSFMQISEATVWCQEQGATITLWWP